MKKLLVVLLLLALVVIGVGFYRGWFGLTVNAEKINEDADTVKTKSAELTDNMRDSDNSDDRPTDNVKASER